MWTKILHLFGIATKQEFDQLKNLEEHFQRGRISSMENRVSGNTTNVKVLSRRLRKLELEMVRQGFWEDTPQG